MHLHGNQVYKLTSIPPRLFCSEYLIPPKVVVELPYSPRARRRTASITELQEHLRPSEAEDWHDWSKRIVKSRSFFNGMRLTLGALGVLFYVTSMG